MSDLVLVDTSAWICFFSRRGFEDLKKALSTLLDEDRAAIAGPILVELIQGTRTTEEKETIKTLIRGLHWFSVSDDHWHKASEMAFALRRKGVTSSAVDTLIAVLAIDYRCSLLHKDSHFELIARNSLLRCYQ
ncbi:MAG: PIN domain-containing protein [Deltaproteobacteria bacterium]|nr:MAG: PIN domain-containing protein [Deltaproteobacteria bacterium]